MHFSIITFPSPLHVGQVFVVCICPSIVDTTCFILPVPLQALQVSIVVPGFAFVPWQVEHSSSLDIEISFSTPKYDSSKVMFILYFKSLPFLGPFLVLVEVLPPNPPPKKDENISPRSPKSENPSNPEVEYE